MGKNTIYVTGHKNPDSDSIISAMAYAYLKQQLGYDAVPVRLGEINPETEYILNLFNEFAPPLVTNIRTCVRDIDFDNVVTCKKEDNLYTALMKMRKHDKKVIAIVDDRRHLLGMATISDITSILIPHDDMNNRLMRETDIQQVADFIGAELIYRASQQHSNGHIHIMADHQDERCKDKIVITGSDDRKIIQAIQMGAASIITTYKEDSFSEEIQKLAQEQNCNLMNCNDSIYEISKRIFYSCSIEKIMSTKLTCFHCEDFVDDVAQKIIKSRYRCYPVLDSQNHIVGTLSRFHVLQHGNRNLILVDHNEFNQSIDGADQANILEIIDHHRIGGMKTASPVYFRNEHVGCTATIINKIFKEQHVEIPEDLAGLLCCAIISDTVNFKSITCTQQDIDAANELAAIGHFDLEKYGPKILAAGAKISNKSCAAIFRNDMKQFEINKIKVVVSQCNIINLESILSLREDMKKVIADYARDSSSGIVLMVFSLIDGSGSYLLKAGSQSKRLNDLLAKNGFNVDEFTFLPKVISRKQQLIPLITEGLND